MLIKLTNVTEGFKNQPLLLNPSYIVSVFPSKDEDDKEFTVVYSSLQTSWSVQETVDEIYALVGECQ